ncbi:MAG TPA: TonB-dependent receptor [Pyrinomonadaceae bacterium]|nr:TonB-dependent receptor [Pyrinomonadaceae bacterium]
MISHRRVFNFHSLTAALTMLLAVCVVQAAAQSSRAEITGSVTDQNGAGIPNASVKISNPATGAEREVQTSESGAYSAPSLEIGTYTIEVSAGGFQTARQENVKLNVGDKLGLDFTLQPGQIGEVVTVTAEAPLVQTETSERGSVVSGREVTELPLSGRNFTQLATLTPGVARAANAGVGGAGPDARQFNNGDPRAGSGGPGASNAQGDTPTSRFARSGGGNLTVNGQRPTNNNFSLDGVDNNEPQFGTIGVFPNPDAIAEFRVSTSIPPAEVGRASGAVINTTTKSGTNEYHGSAYYYGQNSALNAYHPILKRDRALDIANNASFIREKAVQQIHEFGGTFGGAVRFPGYNGRDRTFFFFDYLGQRNNLPFPEDTTVPTALSRAGDFSDFLGANLFQRVNDKGENNGVCTTPGVGNCTNTPLFVTDTNGAVIQARQGMIFRPSDRLAFAGNIIPQSSIDPIAQRILGLYPLPTVNKFNPGEFNPNYAFSRDVREVIDNFGIRIDHRFGNANSLTARYNDQRLKNVRNNFFPTPEVVPPPGLPTAGFGAGEEVGNTRQLVVTDSHSFSPTVLNEFRFGITRINIGINNCGVEGACNVAENWGEEIGIPNVNLGGPETSGGPGIGFTGTGFVEFLGDGGLFRAKSTNPYFADTVTIIKGSHVVKAGGELRMRFLNTICGGCAGFEKGAIGFGGGGTANFDLGSNAGEFTGNSQADALLGATGFAQRSRTFGGPFNLRMEEYGFFVQDDWKVNDRLTLNLGLRYDLLPGPTAPREADGRIGYYFPEERRVILAGDDGDRVVELDKNNFGPRLGFAYALNNEKTMVVRGGYGLSYTLDGVDYPPGVRNPPSTNITFANWTLSQGPPLPTPLDPANVPTGTNLFTVDREQRTGMTHQFQLSFQYQFARDWSFDIGYVGNRTDGLLATFQQGSGGQGIALNSAGDLINSVLLYSNAAESSFDSMQVQLIRRFARNVQGQISYTWGHTIDNATGVFNGLGDSRNQGRQGPSHPFDLDFDRSNSVLDIRHLLSANAIIDLPFGSGQRFLNEGGALDRLVGGWQLNIIQSARSGFPFSVVCQCGLVRPSLVGDPFANPPTDRYLNAAAFSTAVGITTVTNAAGQPVSFGNLGRNTFRGPSIWNTDLSVFKNTTIFEGLRFQLGVEFFNVWNHTNLTVPNNDFDDPGFGRFDGAYPGRFIQYRAKFIF